MYYYSLNENRFHNALGGIIISTLNQGPFLCIVAVMLAMLCPAEGVEGENCYYFFWLQTMLKSQLGKTHTVQRK